MSHRDRLLLLPPNRVWRTYPGGRTLDTLAQRDARDAGALVAEHGAASAPPASTAPADTHMAEDWIASTTRAVNPGRQHISEGISQVRVGHDPRPQDFAQLLASDPEYFLGQVHANKYGAQPQLLVKFLDSGTRLHFQVHPTREFAQRVLGAPSGKTEAYHILAVREKVEPVAVPAEASREGRVPNGLPSAAPAIGARGTTPPTFAPVPPSHIYVGFQRPPSPARLREYIATQNIAAIESCFDPIPVRPGDTFLIPGGTPHALGEGIFMVEIQEPSDLVIRFEFERAGYILPEPARFMGRDLDFALTVFNLTPLTAEDVATRVRCPPRRRRELGPGSWQDELIGPAQTDCFRVARTQLGGPVVKDETSCAIAIVTAGAVMVGAGGETHHLHTYEKYFLPAGLGPVTLTPVGGAAGLLECFPPA